MKKVYKLIFLSILSILLIVQSKVAYSESPTSDFSVEAILEGHQKDKSITYWWLQVEKTQSINLKLKISNGNEENNFEITSNQAVNNNNFTLDYSLSAEEVSQYLHHKNSNFNFYQDIYFDETQEAGKLKITLAPNEVREITINLKIPKEGIKGQLIGGINVTKVPKESDRQEGILNVYSNVVALVMEDKDYSESHKQNLEFALEKSNEKEQVIKIKNSNSFLLSNMNIKAVIKDQKGEVVSEFSNPKTVVVPNASVSIKLNNQKELVKGAKDYLTVDSSNQTFKRNLIVSDSGNLKILEKKKEEIQPLNKKSVGLSLILMVVISSGGIYAYFKK